MCREIFPVGSGNQEGWFYSESKTLTEREEAVYQALELFTGRRIRSYDVYFRALQDKVPIMIPIGFAIFPKDQFLHG
jgi:hypothetical protein